MSYFIIIFLAAIAVTVWYRETSQCYFEEIDKTPTFNGTSNTFSKSEMIWEAVNIRHNTWKIISELFDNDPFKIGVWGTGIITLLAFWSMNICFLFIDYTGRPKALLKYKVQESKNVQVKPEKLRKAILLVIINQTIISAPVMIACYYLMRWRGCSFGDELPSLSSFIWEIPMILIIEEIGFYYSHRLLHHPRLYKHIHKIHHEWTAPISVTALYAHPVEHILTNLIPVMAGPLICASHITTTWLWFAMALTNTTISHCGYHLPFMPSQEAHDFHHLKFNQNYGALVVLDWLHGTNAVYTRTKQFERDFTSLSLTPLKELIRDDSKDENFEKN